MGPSAQTGDNEIVSYINVEDATRESRSIHWPAVFAGVFVSMLAYFVLMSLGLAIGAGQMKDVIAGSDAGRSLSTGAGLWFLGTALISLYVGSYASSRVSGIILTRVGYIQGLVVAALFFTLMITQAGLLFGAVGSGIGALKDAIGGAAVQAFNSPQLSSVVDDALGDLNFKSSPQTVSAGVLSRVLRGDTNSAANYLAAQTGISRADASARLEALGTQVKATAVEVSQRSADAARTIGWASFALMLLGSMAATLGGVMGAQMNIRRPVDELDLKAVQRSRARRNRPAYT